MSQPNPKRRDGRTFPLYGELNSFDLTCGTICSHLKQHNNRADTSEYDTLCASFRAVVFALYQRCKDDVYAKRYENMPYDDYRQWGYNTGIMKELLSKWLTATIGVRQWQHRQSIKGAIAE